MRIIWKVQFIVDLSVVSLASVWSWHLVRVLWELTVHSLNAGSSGGDDDPYVSKSLVTVFSGVLGFLSFESVSLSVTSAIERSWDELAAERKCSTHIRGRPGDLHTNKSHQENLVGTAELLTADLWYVWLSSGKYTWLQSGQDHHRTQCDRAHARGGTISSLSWGTFASTQSPIL